MAKTIKGRLFMESEGPRGGRHWSRYDARADAWVPLRARPRFNAADELVRVVGGTAARYSANPSVHGQRGGGGLYGRFRAIPKERGVDRAIADQLRLSVVATRSARGERNVADRVRVFMLDPNGNPIARFTVESFEDFVDDAEDKYGAALDANAGNSFVLGIMGDDGDLLETIGELGEL